MLLTMLLLLLLLLHVGDLGHFLVAAMKHLLSVLLLLLPASLAHFRLACPPPRSQQTGIKTGPCGGDGASASRFVLVRLRLRKGAVLGEDGPPESMELVAMHTTDRVWP